MLCCSAADALPADLATLLVLAQAANEDLREEECQAAAQQARLLHQGGHEEAAPQLACRDRRKGGPGEGKAAAGSARKTQPRSGKAGATTGSSFAVLEEVQRQEEEEEEREQERERSLAAASLKQGYAMVERLGKGLGTIVQVGAHGHRRG